MVYKDLYFDQTFSLNFNYISKILELTKEGVSYTRYEIRNLTGIPCGTSSGKIVPHIKYAKYMGLIEYSYKQDEYLLELTALGQFIYVEDRYFMENLTKLLMYYNMTSYNGGSDLWKLVIKKILFKYNENLSTQAINNEIEGIIGKNIKLIGFKGCFIENGAFNNLELIDIDTGYKLQSLRLTEENKNLIAYTLVNELYLLDKTRSEYTIEEICSRIEWGKCFGWSATKTQVILEKLADEDLILLNRQLNPVIVKVLLKPNNLLERAYDMLI